MLLVEGLACSEYGGGGDAGFWMLGGGGAADVFGDVEYASASLASGVIWKLVIKDAGRAGGAQDNAGSVSLALAVASEFFKEGREGCDGALNDVEQASASLALAPAVVVAGW